MKSTIGNFLIRRLKELGNEHIFGVPGDFNLQFLDQVEKAEDIEFLGCCNELNAAYAADGYSRLRGVSTLLVTYGVGDLSAICGVAGAATEHVPMICITGAPPLLSISNRDLLHHTLAEGNYDDILTCMTQFTAAQSRLMPSNAVTEIDRVLKICMQQKRPVYLQLPSDISHIEVDVPDTPLGWQSGSNPERLSAAVDHLLRLWQAAENPAVLVDMDADRFNYAADLLKFVEQSGAPYATLGSGRAVLPSRHRQSRGTYGGSNSAPGARELIEEADFLLSVSNRLIEVNSGMFTAKIPADGLAAIHDHAVIIQDKIYYAVEPHDLLQALGTAIEDARCTIPVTTELTELPPVEFGGNTHLTHERMWPRLARFLRPADVVLAEAGTSNIGLAPQALPNNITYINQGIWGAIGHALPAVMGTHFASPERRQILFIGDGSLQLTVQEISTMLIHNQKPVIFVINNRGYTIERYIYGMHARYNDVANWKYKDIPAVFTDRNNFLSLSAATEDELESVLARAENPDRLILVELHLDPYDAPQGLKTFGPAVAEFDYGPLGPQRNEGEES